MRNKIDYSITPVYFYRFVCNDPNITNLYVGSSINLTDRKRSHKTRCNNPNDKNHHLLVYKTIRENGGWDNWRMLEIENKIVKDKTEAKQREQYWIEFYNAQMNTYKLIFNQHEYREQHKEQLSNYQRKYREQHKEQLSEYNRKYREQQQEELSDYQRKYREQHQEEINAKQHEQRQRKKEQKMMELNDVNINLL